MELGNYSLTKLAFPKRTLSMCSNPGTTFIRCLALAVGFDRNGEK